VSTFKTFEEIEAWQKARELTRRVYEATTQGAFARDYGLRDQVRRACVSVMSNIAEGHGRRGTKEFLQFLAMSLGSTNEVHSQLYVALDRRYVDEREFRQLTALVQETARMIGGLARYLRTTDLKGSKFAPPRSGPIVPSSKFMGKTPGTKNSDLELGTKNHELDVGTKNQELTERTKNQ
jgi:four helix bundle protein